MCGHEFRFSRIDYVSPATINEFSLGGGVRQVTGFQDRDLQRVLEKPKDNNPVVSPVAAFSHTLTMHLRDMLNAT